jgi:hypothetical protein
MKTTVERAICQREAKCRVCNEPMDRFTEGVVIRNCHVSPKVVDLWFHRDCAKKLGEGQ